MRLTKLSLVAAMLIGSTAFAIENTKVSGDVKLFYGTMDTDNTAGLTNAASQPTDGKTSFFDADGAYGDAAVNLGLTTDLTKGVSAGVKGTFITTLGLESNLVSNTWSNVHGVTANPAGGFSGGYQLDDAMYIGELWVAGSAFDTTLKVGRQALDTPLAFTETWGIDENTFEAAVVINQSIPDTTLVGAWVGKSNGSADDISASLTINDISAAQAGYVAQGGKFNTFAQDGVYVAGLVNNSIKPLTVQAWYYSLQQMAEAYWLQADVNVEGILAGAQYTQVDADKFLAGVDKDKAYAVMLGYEAKDVATVKVAYSSVDDEGTVGVANVATGSNTVTTMNGSGAQSKLYTEMWWAYGAVSQTGADSYSITAETTVAGIDLLAGYYASDIKAAAGSTSVALNGAVDVEVTEIALVASKSFGPLDTSLALIFDSVEDKLDPANDVDANHLQVYLTYNF
jgi:imipenem/basic amino acid-specific outer membrane pore